LCFKDFLEHVPPYQKFTIEDLAVKPHYDDITKPQIEAYCDSEKCGGIRYFDCEDAYSSLSNGEITIVGLHYRCRHCMEGYKWFALLTLKTKDGCSGYAIKLGEWPQFGEPVPPQVISLIEPDRELFLKGKDSEDQGFGIGAFAYYRRVVENQWQRLIDEIIKVLTHLKKPTERIENFKKAKSETQFCEAVTTIKDEIPESLLIAGHHNPLVLLHKILSEDVHKLSDNECLKRAKSIRLILCELSDKLANSLKDYSELKGALTELFDSDKGPQPDSEQTEE
jgi:hypothetical protein